MNKHQILAEKLKVLFPNSTHFLYYPPNHTVLVLKVKHTWQPNLIHWHVVGMYKKGFTVKYHDEFIGCEYFRFHSDNIGFNIFVRDIKDKMPLLIEKSIKHFIQFTPFINTGAVETNLY